MATQFVAYLETQKEELQLDICRKALTWVALEEYFYLGIMGDFFTTYFDDALFPSDELERMMQESSMPVLDEVAEMIKKFASEFQQCSDTNSKETLLMEATVRIHKFVAERTRLVLTPSQMEALEEEFKKTKYICYPRIRELSCDLCLTEREVAIWFDKRRERGDESDRSLQQPRDVKDLDYFFNLDLEDVLDRSIMISSLGRAFSLVADKSKMNSDNSEGAAGIVPVGVQEERSHGNRRCTMFRRRMNRFKACLRKFLLCC